MEKAVSGDHSAILLENRTQVARISRLIESINAGSSGHNGDGTAEVYLIDRSTPPALRLGPAQPTLLEWDAGSGPFLYDVIRGDLAALAAAGPAVDLGTVTCIENDSVDNATLALEDPEVPAPGQGFFYLYRGAPGGDYGSSSSGAPRRPAAGDCVE